MGLFIDGGGSYFSTFEQRAIELFRSGNKNQMN
jgi:hypothetical protein